MGSGVMVYFVLTILRLALGREKGKSGDWCCGNLNVTNSNTRGLLIVKVSLLPKNVDVVQCVCMNFLYCL